MKTKILSILLAVTLISSVISVSTAFAVEDNKGSSYYSSDGKYTADKLSHKDNGIKSPDGIVDYAGNGTVTDNITGVGDRAQNYSWSAVGYGDYVYIGTCANAMLQTLSFMKSVLGHQYDEEAIKKVFDTMFNGTFFYGEEDGGDPQGIFVKLNTKTGDVKLLMSKATTGTNVLFRNAVEYNGKFYFCGSVNGLPSIYQLNPENDEMTLVYQSISQADYYKAYQQGICVGIRGICTYKGKLMISLVGLDGAYICETDNPSDADSFKVIADMDDLYNYPAYHYPDSIYGGSIWDMIEYNDSLYVVLCTGTSDNKPDENSMQSFAIVRGDTDSKGQWKWTSVAGDQEKDGAKYTFGIDPERTRSGAANLYVYNDYLYIGEYNDEEIALEKILFNTDCDFINANLKQSVNLYRMDKKENVELVMGDADKMFPDGSITGYGSGFGKKENQYIWRMQEFDGKLYVGTFDTSSLLETIGQFTNGDLLEMTPEEWERQIEYLIDFLRSIQTEPSTGDSQAVTDSNGITAFAETNTKNQALSLADSLEKVEDNIDKGISVNVYEEYKKAFDGFKNLSDRFSSYIQSRFEKVLSSETLNKMKSIITCSAYLSRAERGFDLYTIDKDMNVETITTNGFGNPYNHGCRVFAVNNSGLILGTANPFYGTQVWNVKAVETTPSTTDTSTDPSSTEATNPTTEPTDPTVTNPTTEPTDPTSAKPTTSSPSLANKSVKKSAGSTYRIVVNNAGGKKITYSLDNKKILRVSSKGKVTFLKKGSGTVTVKVGSKKLTFKGTVTSDPKLIYKNKAVKASKVYKVKKGNTLTIKIKGKASALNNKYNSTKIAKIKGKAKSSKIKIVGLKKGKTTLKITVNHAKVLKIKVKVK